MSSSSLNQRNPVVDDGCYADMTKERLARIKPELRIRLVFLDQDIAVVDKPCNLRSVPGHLHPQPSSTRVDEDGGTKVATSSRKRPRAGAAQKVDDAVSAKSTTAANDASSSRSRGTTNRMTAQQAWEAAIRSFSSSRGGTSVTSSTSNTTNSITPDISVYLKQLSATDSLVASIPRKWKLFHRYIVRNRTRIFSGAGKHDTTTGNDQKALQIIARKMHAVIQAEQELFMNVPESTRDEDSAYGQLKMLLRNDPASEGKSQPQDEGDADVEHQTPIYVVHRLDCETSGVMVFARNQAAASTLSRAWRERDQVSKIYLASVEDWPPLHGSNAESVGRVELLLAPSDERLKWKVVHANDTNTKEKPSITGWKVLEERHKSSSGGDSDRHSVILELKPITGRTHQLRIVCAHLGSGIEGDSLYGKDKLARLGDGGRRLLLHAHKLSFVHPGSKSDTADDICEFISWPEWYQKIEISK